MRSPRKSSTRPEAAPRPARRVRATGLDVIVRRLQSLGRLPEISTRISMKRRRFGPDATVSAVGFGCMSVGGFYGPTTESDSLRALARALEIGADFWDTANVYGEGLSETVIGKFLAEDRSRRAKITLATKFAIRRLPDGRRDHAHARGARRLAEATRRRPGRSLLRASDRPAHSRRGHGRRTRPPRRSRKDRRDRTIGDRPRHAAARLSRASDRRRPVGILALDPRSRIGARPGLRRDRRAVRGLLAGRARLFQRPLAGRRELRPQGLLPSRQSALPGSELAAQP